MMMMTKKKTTTTTTVPLQTCLQPRCPVDRQRPDHQRQDHQPQDHQPQDHQPQDHQPQDHQPQGGEDGDRAQQNRNPRDQSATSLRARSCAFQSANLDSQLATDVRSLPEYLACFSWATFKKPVGGGGDFPVASVKGVATGRLLRMPFANSQKNFSGWYAQTAGQFAT